ncbi:glycosyltransferase [Rahnella sp. PAMC 25559]|uniref:glycosyltransferase n=1 Tax=Rahnella sp. PAMC 25559 TaxID=3423225 RepID=UPI003D66EC08
MISVCIPTYNGEKYIKEQLASILSQLSLQDEIIISDNYSTDNTLSVIRDINDPRIKVFLFKPDEKLQLKINTLAKVSLNVQNALSKANGDYIYLSDQDDIWLDGRVSETLQLLKNDKPSVVVCNCKVIDENNDTLIESYFSYIKPSSSVFRSFHKSSFHGCCMAFNKNVILKASPFPKYAIGHDLWLGIVGSHYGSVYFVEKPLVLYRRHRSTVTTTGFESSRTLYDKVKYRFLIILSIFKGIILK